MFFSTCTYNNPQSQFDCIASILFSFWNSLSLSCCNNLCHNSSRSETCSWSLYATNRWIIETAVWEKFWNTCRWWNGYDWKEYVRGLHVFRSYMCTHINMPIYFGILAETMVDISLFSTTCSHNRRNLHTYCSRGTYTLEFGPYKLITTFSITQLMCWLLIMSALIIFGHIIHWHQVKI